MSVNCEFTPLKLSDVVARLETKSIFSSVAGAFELADADAKNIYVSPSAYVLLDDETANTLDDAQLLETTVSSQIGVVLVARSYSLTAERRTESSDAIDSLRSATIDALHGWKPPGARRVLTYRGGSILKNKSEFVSYMLRFATEYQFSKLVGT